MYRRRLVTGAAALAAMAALRDSGRADAQSCTPVATPQPARSLPVQVCVGNTEFVLSDVIINDTTSNSLNSRKLSYAPRLSDITDIVLAYPGFGLNNPEQDFPVSYTVTASLEYPLGTPPRQLFFGGAPSVTVTAGRTLIRTDPFPITIPAGAQFAAKTHATWPAGNFWLTSWTAAQMVGEWTARGTGLPDHTLDNIAQTPTSNLAGFGPIIYGTLNTPTAVVGMVGDSWGSLSADWLDPNVGYNAWGRAMRGAIPFINLSKGGDSDANYFARPEGRNLILRNGITHCIWEMGGNDLAAVPSVATMIGNLEAAIGPFLDRGVQCYAMTLTPRSTSTDGWLTARHQTPDSLAMENIRVPYNAWLRTNFASIGLTGIFDVAHAIDPNDSGIFGSDAGVTTSVSSPCAGFPTLANGVVSSVANAWYVADSSAGGGYPPGSLVMPCVVYSYANTTGSGAAVNAVTDPVHPWVASYKVANGGSGYNYPPMISTAGNWTSDGFHVNTRGWNEVLHACPNIAPETFVL